MKTQSLCISSLDQARCAGHDVGAYTLIGDLSGELPDGGASVNTVPKPTKTPYVTVVFRPKKGWYGRWVEPASKKRREVQLERQGITNAPDREKWKRAKFDEIIEYARRITLGHVATTMKTSDAVAAYLADCDARLRERTRSAYREAVLSLQASMVKRGRTVVQDIRPVDLMAYRDSVVSLDGKPSTKSTHLSRVRACLEWWRRRRMLPHVDKDAIVDACRALRRVKPQMHPLQAAQVRSLVRGALKTQDPMVAAFVSVTLLTGCRLGELEHLRWTEVDLAAKPSGEIRLGEGTKTHTSRVVDLAVCPTVKDILGALPRRGEYVFGSVDEKGVSHPLSRDVNKRWKNALQGSAAGKWTWQHLRQTTGTWLTNSPGIFGGSSAYRSARQLGHRVQVAEEHYLGLMRGIPPSATTLEDAMKAGSVFALVLRRLTEKV